MVPAKHGRKKALKLSKLLHKIPKLIDLVYKISKVVEVFLKFF